MATITIRNLDESLKSSLRHRAAAHACSMEEEVRQILKRVLLNEDERKGLGTKIHTKFVEADGVELDLPPRSFSRDPPDFNE